VAGNVFILHDNHVIPEDIGKDMAAFLLPLRLNGDPPDNNRTIYINYQNYPRRQILELRIGYQILRYQGSGAIKARKQMTIAIQV
jgi:hypothetical protein